MITRPRTLLHVVFWVVVLLAAAGIVLELVGGAPHQLPPPAM